jgi:catechol 2,3-dioxygenase-like lactoylglutathione lyase family enzyme
MGVVTTTTGGIAVLEKVFYTSVLVSDQDQALDFYTNVLGLEKRVENLTPDGPRFLTVGVKGTTSSWFSGPGHRGRPSRRWDARQRRSRIETDDCRKTVEELKSRGVEFVSDVLEFPWATSRSSRIPTATGYRYERAASPPERNRLGASVALALVRAGTSGSAGAPARRTRACCAARISRSAVRTRFARQAGRAASASCASSSRSRG